MIVSSFVGLGHVVRRERHAGGDLDAAPGRLSYFESIEVCDREVLADLRA